MSAHTTLLAPLQFIYSSRSFEHRPWFHIVYEWEDELQAAIGLPLKSNYHPFYLNKTALKFLEKGKGYKPFQLWDGMFPKKEQGLCFDMGPRFSFSHLTGTGVVPVIIDFWKTVNLARFEDVYQNCKSVFISSLEALQYLKVSGCQLPLHHLPLSLPDRYRLNEDSVFQKDIDLLSIGRINPVLYGYFKQLIAAHPQISYVIQKPAASGFSYETNLPQFDVDLDDRAAYFNLIYRTKIGFYATPGIDGGEARTGGFNPVTPRFFELLSGGLHCVGRYPKTVETDFFELEKMCAPAESYEQFEATILHCLNSPAPIVKNSRYLSKHYTTRRIPEIKKALPE